MSYRFFITDVFSEGPYAGNRLATLFDAGDLDGAEMQKIARAFNFAETTFLVGGSGDAGFEVRIFTPASEIPFAGHPTLGTAFLIRKHLLGGTGDTLQLNLGVGPIKVTFSEDRLLWMRQNPPQFGDRFEKAEVAEVLGLKESDLEPELPIETVSTGIPSVTVPLVSRDALQRIDVDNAAYLRFVDRGAAPALLAFAREGYEAGQDLAVRMFAPALGVDEDPATGSANGALAAYLLEHGVFGAGPVDVRSGQGYCIERPSQLYLRAQRAEAGGEIEVEVGGRVRETAEGTWHS